MVATHAGVASMGSRQTRRQRRTREKRAQLRKSISTAPREAVFIVVGMVVTVIEVVARGVRWGLLWGLIALAALLVFSSEKGRPFLTGTGRDVLAGVMRVADKGFRRDPLLFVGLLGSGSVALTYVVAGKASVAVLFCLSAVFMGVGLWIGDRREGTLSETLG